MPIDITECGADSSGSEPIDDALSDAIEDGATVEFPPGTYRVEKIATDHDDLHLVGTNATLVPTDRAECVSLLDATGDGFVFDGFELDFREVSYPPRIDVQGDDWRFSNVVVRGYCGTNGKDMDIHGVSFMRPVVKSEDATGIVEDVYLHEGSGPPGERSNRRAFLVKNRHRGHLKLNRVWAEQWGENTFYGNDVQGTVTIQNCFFRNTNVGLRVGGDSEIRNCTFVKDGKPPKQGWSGGMRSCGVIVEGDDQDAYPGRVTVTDCDFSFTHSHESTDSPVVANAPTQEVVVSNCRVRYDGNRSDAVEIHCDDRLEQLTLENLHVTNNSDDRAAVGVYGKPGEYGTVSGVIGGSNAADRGGYVYDNFELGSPNPPNADPPLASPPAVGQTPNGRENQSETNTTKSGQTDDQAADRDDTDSQANGSTADNGTPGPAVHVRSLVEDATNAVEDAIGRVERALRSWSK